MLHELIDYKIYSDKKLISPSLESQSFSLYIFGDFMGCVVDKKPIYVDESLNLIKTNLEKGLGDSFLSNFFPNIVGSCVFIYVENNGSTFFYSSFSSSGVFVSNTNSKLKFTFDESSFLKLVEGSEYNLIEEELLCNMTLHTIFCRSPFITFVKEICRVPSASYLIIDNSNNSVLKRGLLFKKKSLTGLNRGKDFQLLLDSVLHLKNRFYKDKMYLFFSGGIDSSLLLANFMKIKKDILAIFIPYHGIRSRAAYTASFISKILGIKMLVTKMKIADKDFIKKTAKSGFGTVPGMQYIGAGNRLDQLNLGKDKINVLTGQNADTLIHIDTFAPASTVIGYKRFMANHKARDKRYVYASSNLDKLTDYKKFEKLLKHIASGLDEHEPFQSYTQNEPTINKKIRNHKLLYSYEPIIKILQRDYFNKDDFSNLKSSDKIFLLKIMRWFRTVQNVPINYRNLSKESKINRLIPYTEGPISNFAINYEILDDDHQFEKKIIYKNFSSLSNLNYRFLVNVAFILSLPKLISDKLRFLILKRKLISDEYKENIVYLTSLSKSYVKIINIFNDIEIKNYLEELQSYISNNKIDKIPLKKQDEVVRYAGTIYFLNNILNKKYD